MLNVQHLHTHLLTNKLHEGFAANYEQFFSTFSFKFKKRIKRIPKKKSPTKKGKTVELLASQFGSMCTYVP